MIASDLNSADDLSLPGFDFRELRQFINQDQSQLMHLLDMFLDNFSQIDQNIKTALASNNCQLAHQLLHQVKGTAGNIGAFELHKISEVFEKQLGQNQLKPETQGQWQAVFTTTLQTLSTVLCQYRQTVYCETTAVAATPLNEATYNLLLNLEKLLAKDSYIDSALIEQLSEQAKACWSEELNQLLHLIRSYRYGDARRILPLLLKR